MGVSFGVQTFSRDVRGSADEITSCCEITFFMHPKNSIFVVPISNGRQHWVDLIAKTQAICCWCGDPISQALVDAAKKISSTCLFGKIKLIWNCQFQYCLFQSDLNLKDTINHRWLEEDRKLKLVLPICDKARCKRT